MTVIGCVLAGGQSRRMGGNKAFVNFRGKPLIGHVVERAEPQVDALIINANDPALFIEFGCRVIPDEIGDAWGPLAGVHTGLNWLDRNRRDAEWLATFACDTPLFPRDLVRRLMAEAESSGAHVAVATSGNREHPVFALWHAGLLADAAHALRDGIRKMDDFVASHSNVRVAFDTEGDPFFNINTPEDLKKAEGFA